MWHGEWSPSSSWKLCPAVALTSSKALCCCCCWTYLAYFRFEIILPRTSSGELALICPETCHWGFQNAFCACSKMPPVPSDVFVLSNQVMMLGSDLGRSGAECRVKDFVLVGCWVGASVCWVGLGADGAAWELHCSTRRPSGGERSSLVPCHQESNSKNIMVH